MQSMCHQPGCRFGKRFCPSASNQSYSAQSVELRLCHGEWHLRRTNLQWTQHYRELEPNSPKINICLPKYDYQIFLRSHWSQYKSHFSFSLHGQFQCFSIEIYSKSAWYPSVSNSMFWSAIEMSPVMLWSHTRMWLDNIIFVGRWWDRLLTELGAPKWRKDKPLTFSSDRKLFLKWCWWGVHSGWRLESTVLNLAFF